MPEGLQMGSWTVATIAILALACALVVVWTPTGQAELSSQTLVVDDGRSCPSAGYESIQPALDDASEGDTVQVCPGFYYEALTIETDDLILFADDHVTLVGSRISETPAVRVEASNVTVDGFKIYDYEIGVQVDGNASRVSNQSIDDSRVGIHLQSSNRSTIRDNTIRSPSLGVVAQRSMLTAIRNNTIAIGDTLGLWATSRTGQILTLLDQVRAIVDGETQLGLASQLPQPPVEAPGLGVEIRGNRISDPHMGVFLDGTAQDVVADNRILRTDSFGLLAWRAHEADLSDNLVKDSARYGVSLLGSDRFTLQDNRLVDNRWNLHIDGHLNSPGGYEHEIAESNTVDGRPVVYLRDVADRVVGPRPGPDPGYVGVVDSTNVTVRDLTIQNQGEGVLLAQTASSTVRNVTVRDSGMGIALRANSHGNLVTGVDASALGDRGIALFYSSGNTVEASQTGGIDLSGAEGNRFVSNDVRTVDVGASDDNVFLQNRMAGISGFLADGNEVLDNRLTGPVELDGSHVWTIRGNEIQLPQASGTAISLSKGHASLVEANRVQGGATGIGLSETEDAVLRNNTITETGLGLDLSDSQAALVRGTVIRDADTGISVHGTSLPIASRNHDIDRSNTIEGDPIVYLNGVDNRTIGTTTEAAYVGIVDSRNVTIRGQMLSENGQGAIVVNSSTVSLRDVTAARNTGPGLEVHSSRNVTIRDSVLRGNEDHGLAAIGSENVTVVSGRILANEASGYAALRSEGDEVRGSLIRDNGGSGTPLAGHGLVAVDASGLEIARNRILGHATGIDLGATDPSGTLGPTAIDGNILLDNERGIDLGPVDTDASPVVRSNRFDGNTEFGVHNGHPDLTLDARENFWGASSGPSGGVEDPSTDTVADGSGDRVSDDVRFDPWLGPPVVEPIPNQATREQETLRFRAQVQNAEDRTVSLSADPLPAGAEFTDHGNDTATFAWTPSVGQAGSYNVTVMATDALGLTDTQTVHISVGTVNEPPIVDAPLDVEILPGGQINVTATANDSDGPEPIQWTVTEDPDEGSRSAVTVHEDGSVTWSWNASDDAQDGPKVTFRADDGVDSGFATTNVTVLQAPTLGLQSPIETSTGVAAEPIITGEPVQLRVRVTDPDSAVSDVRFRPRGPSSTPIDAEPAAGDLYTANVTYTDPASLEIVAVAEDAHGLFAQTREEAIVVTNSPPEPDAGSTRTANATHPTASRTLALNASALDPEHRPLVASDYAWTLPASATPEDEGSRVVDGRHLSHAFPVGVHSLQLAVEDAQGAVGTDTVTVAVDDALDLRALLLSVGPIEATEQPVLAGQAQRDDGSALASKVWINVTHVPSGTQTTSTTVDPGSGGVFALWVPADIQTGPQHGVNLPGEHRVTLETSAPSRTGAAVQDVERARATVTYTVTS